MTASKLNERKKQDEESLINQNDVGKENMCERSHEWEIMDISKLKEAEKKLFFQRLADVVTRQHTVSHSNCSINQISSSLRHIHTPFAHKSPNLLENLHNIFVNFYAWLTL